MGCPGDLYILKSSAKTEKPADSVSSTAALQCRQTDLENKHYGREHRKVTQRRMLIKGG